MISIQENIIYDKYSHVLRQIDSYNLNNAEFFQLKENYYKKSSSSSNWFSNISSLFRKINVFDIVSAEYTKKVMHIASIKYNHQQQFSFLEQVFAPTSVYLYEFFKIKNKQKYIFGQKTQDTEKIEISFNENKDEFLAQIQFFKVILNIAQVAFNDIDLLHGSRRQVIQKLEQNYNPRLINPGEVYFTLHFRQYFQHSLFEFICTSESIKHRTEITPKLVNYLYKICSQLQLSITQNNRTKIANQISKIQNQLFSITKLHGFEDCFEYMETGKEKKMIGQNQHHNMQTSMFKFDNQQDHKSNRNSLSSSQKKRSVFGPFRSSSNQSSPIKDSDRFSIKESSLSKQIQCKLLHLQLLRFILSESPPSRLMFGDFTKYEATPLHKVYESNFRSFYRKYSKSLYELKGVKFNSELDSDCVFKVKAKAEDMTVIVELYHKEKLILKCDALDFTL